MTNPTISYQKNYGPMGFCLRLVSNCPAVIEAADVSFGRFARPSPGAPVDFMFSFSRHNIDDGPPGQPVFRMSNNMIYQTTGRDSTLVAHLGEGEAWGYFSASTLANQAYFRWHFLELALFMMLEARGLMGVHGAALVKNGKAILLRAKSGGGKSTLAYAAAKSRFQLLAEDVVWVDTKNNGWWGMPWSLHLLPQAKILFPELVSYPPILQTNQEMKLAVDPEQIRPGSTTVYAQPGPLVFLERLPANESRLERITPVQAQALWPAARTGLEMKLPHHRQIVDTLLQEPIYRLYLGDQIEAALDILEPLLG